MTDRITAILDHWLPPLPDGVREGLVEDLEALVAGHAQARPDLDALVDAARDLAESNPAGDLYSEVCAVVAAYRALDIPSNYRRTGLDPRSGYGEERRRRAYTASIDRLLQHGRTCQGCSFEVVINEAAPIAMIEIRPEPAYDSVRICPAAKSLIDEAVMIRDERTKP